MADLHLRFEFEPGANLKGAEDEIRELLARLDMVAAVDARVDDARITGLELVGAIAVGVQIVRGTRQFAHEVHRLLAELKGLCGDVAGLRTIALEVGPTKLITVEHVTDDDIASARRASSATAQRPRSRSTPRPTR
jgi:hypothetical protein